MTPINPNALSILIIEDDESVQRAWQMFLTDNRGHTLTFAVNGDQAIDAVSRATTTFDLIICDGELGRAGSNREHGWDIIKRLRTWFQDNHGRLPPVMAVSGSLTPAAERSWQIAGVEHYHHKPFDLAQILSTIRTLVGPA